MLHILIWSLSSNERIKRIVNTMMLSSAFKKILRESLTVVIALLLLASSATAAGNLIYTDIVTNGGTNWNTEIGEGQHVVWTHDIPADVLANATHGGVIVGAKDVDFPSCCQAQNSCPSESNPYLSADKCEHDMLSVNGNQIGYLEGENNSLKTFELIIPINKLKAGENTFRVDADVTANPIDWVLWVKSSELYLYYDESFKDPVPVPVPVDEVELPPLINKLEVVKRQGQTTVLPGMRQVYQVEIKNLGNQPVTGLRVSDELDEHLRYISDTSSARHGQNGNNHSWSFNRSLQPHEKLSFNIVTELEEEVMGGIAISNTAYARVDQISETVASNTVTAYSSFVPVTPDGIRVNKRVIGNSVRVGSILTYIVTIENVSLGRVFNLQMEDILPRGFSIVSGRVVRDGTLFRDPSGTRILTWNLGNLAQDASTTLKYQVVVGANVKKGQNRNTARVQGVDGGSNVIADEDSAFVNIGTTLEELGRIEVLVFEDHDGNGLQNAEDDGMGEIGLLLAGGQKKRTDADGKAIFDDIRSGYRVVGVDERTLPSESKLIGDSSKLVRVLEGEFVDVAFPVFVDRRASRLQGRVFIDRNGNERFDDNEQLVPSFVAELIGYRKTKGQKGRFVFANIKAGQYMLIIRTQGRNIETPVQLSRGRSKLDIPVPFTGVRFIVEEHN